jgi:cytochrome c peroxidase
LPQLPRSGEVANARIVRHRRCVIAACALIFGCPQISLAPSQPSDQLLESTGTTAKEPITPIPEAAAATDPLKIRLGEHLFRDTRLSHDNSRSCLSCHDLSANGAGRNRHDVGLDGSDLPLNTLTIFNAALNFRFGWEGKFRTLEQDAAAALESPRIMGSNASEVLEKLKADAGTRREFAAAYGRGPDIANVLDAIAAFERTLVTPGSRFDQWLTGDAAALSEDEQNGYRLFKSLGCVSCHQGVNIGGNLFQRHGIFRPLAAPQPEILRVPSLRNVAATPPYFHDGSAPTLDDAVRKMGAAQLNSTLTDRQVSAIVAFLQTLTGQYRGLPVGGAP